MRRRRLRWVISAVTAVLAITCISVRGPRHAGIELQEQRALGDAFPVPKNALREYLEHTEGTSKLARLNPSMAAHLESRDGDAMLITKFRGGKDIRTRLKALHLHQMVSAWELFVYVPCTSDPFS
jgi:hypothetical protein